MPSRRLCDKFGDYVLRPGHGLGRVDDVARGIPCGCVCLESSRLLTPKKSVLPMDHFANAAMTQATT